MARVHLRHDEWHIVMKFLPRNDLLNMLRVCRLFYDLGLPLLLQSRIEIKPENAISFREFITSDLPRFAFMLRDLQLQTTFEFQDEDGAYVIEDEIPHVPFEEILQAAVNLNSLYISDCGEKVIHRFPHLVDRINSLKKLKRLALHDVDGPFCSHLINLPHPWSLTHLHIDWTWWDDDPPEQWWDCDLSPVLGHCKDTLESFYLGYLKFSNLHDVVFPRVHTVGVWLLEFGLRTSTLVKTFPKLLTLHVQSGTVPFPTPPNADFDQWRISNEHPEGVSHWPCLHRVVMPYPVLYGLNLKCPILFLEPFLDREQRHSFLTRQRIVHLAGSRSRSIDIVLRDDFRKLSRHLKHFYRCSPQLTHISYTIMFSSFHDRSPSATQLNMFMDRIVNIHRWSSGCTHLCITFHFFPDEKTLVSRFKPFWDCREEFAQRLRSGMEKYLSRREGGRYGESVIAHV
ncbi:hypothetical protein K474DRAFT_1708541 [Panus rudis PR-1116 ss-1]|nr:hypothetical protein K474DRAFT_1708541 [Panus rudis PR-1116 ss-1]